MKTMTLLKAITAACLIALAGSIWAGPSNGSENDCKTMKASEIKGILERQMAHNCQECTAHYKLCSCKQSEQDSNTCADRYNSCAKRHSCPKK